MSSGANRLINSVNTIKGNSQSALKEKLMNGNKQAVIDTEEGIGMKINSDSEAPRPPEKRFAIKNPQ